MTEEEREFKQKIVDSIRVRSETSIVSCLTCKGIGLLSEEVCTSYHRGEYGTKWIACPHCEGQGRVMQTKMSASINNTASTRFRPVTQDDIQGYLNHEP